MQKPSFKLLIGADIINLTDPLYCIYVFIKVFIMMFFYDESFFF